MLLQGGVGLAERFLNTVGHVGGRNAGGRLLVGGAAGGCSCADVCKVGDGVLLRVDSISQFSLCGFGAIFLGSNFAVKGGVGGSADFGFCGYGGMDAV